MTTSTDNVEKVAAEMDVAQQRALLNSYRGSGPCDDHYVADQRDFEALYFSNGQYPEPLVTPAGRILPFGLLVKERLEREK